MCELLHLCGVNDHGDATITSVTVDPTSAVQGAKIEFDMQWTSKNGTGTGYVFLTIDTIDGVPVQTFDLNPDSPPGQYGIKWQLSTQPQDDDDGCELKGCEQWL